MRTQLVSTTLHGYRRRGLPLTRGWLTCATLLLAIALCLPFYIGWQFSTALMYPSAFVHPDSPEHYGLAYQRVDIHSARLAAPLKGWLIVNPNAHGRAVLFLHGWRSHKQHMLKDYLRWLASHYTVLAFDHPNHGESPKGVTTLGVDERVDAEAAIALLKKQGYKRIGVMGTSMGGNTAIGVAATDPGVKAVVTDGTYAGPEAIALGYLTSHHYWFPRLLSYTTVWMLELRTWRNMKAVSAAEEIRRLAPRPILLIHGTHDHVVDPENARILYQAAFGHRQMWLVPGADHMSDAEHSPHATEPQEYESRVLAFFDQSL